MSEIMPKKNSRSGLLTVAVLVADDKVLSLLG
jgi:hypothetical protein